DAMLGEGGDDTLDGGGGSDNVYDVQGNNILRGGDGDDRLETGSGNDTLDGGAGVDVLSGGTGIDTYVLKPGSESDLIADQFGSELTIVAVDPSLTPSDVTLARLNPGNDYLSIAINGAADELRVNGIQFGVPNLEIRFGDGTVWDSATISDKLYLQQGTAGNDTLIGGVGDDRLYGNAGSDSLSGLQ